MSAKVSSKKAQEGINNRLQVVMRSGKYTVRSFRLEREDRHLLGSKMMMMMILAAQMDLFLRRRRRRRLHDGLFSKSL